MISLVTITSDSHRKGSVGPSPSFTASHQQSQQLPEQLGRTVEQAGGKAQCWVLGRSAGRELPILATGLTYFNQLS